MCHNYIVTKLRSYGAGIVISKDSCYTVGLVVNWQGFIQIFFHREHFLLPGNHWLIDHSGGRAHVGGGTWRAHVGGGYVPPPMYALCSTEA